MGHVATAAPPPARPRPPGLAAAHNAASIKTVFSGAKYRGGCAPGPGAAAAQLVDCHATEPASAAKPCPSVGMPICQRFDRRLAGRLCAAAAARWLSAAVSVRRVMNSRLNSGRGATIEARRQPLWRAVPVTPRAGEPSAAAVAGDAPFV